MNFKEMGANLGLDEDEFRELVELFIMSVGAEIKKLQQGLTVADAEQVMQCAHAIKGAAGNLGIMDVSDSANTIENQATNKDLTHVAQVVETLKEQFAVVQASVSS
ncbi:MAG: Hpt domain-containing protein [Desulfatitalea sp.]|nr:Hpt domain-containing protein [Desulfatitalea sp.]NNK00816.1 Hpt domain-containing protein [Desulfatitalea sp.]